MRELEKISVEAVASWWFPARLSFGMKPILLGRAAPARGGWPAGVIPGLDGMEGPGWGAREGHPLQIRQCEAFGVMVGRAIGAPGAGSSGWPAAWHRSRSRGHRHLRRHLRAIGRSPQPQLEGGHYVFRSFEEGAGRECWILKNPALAAY